MTAFTRPLALARSNGASNTLRSVFRRAFSSEPGAQQPFHHFNELPLNWVVALSDRTLLHLSGRDSQKFLQNLVTQDVNIISKSSVGIQMKSQTMAYEDTQRPAYLGFLNRESKLICDGILIPRQFAQPTTEIETHFILDIHSNIADTLLQHLKSFRLRSKVEINDVTSEYSMWALGGPDVKEMMGGYKMKVFGNDGALMFFDPRHCDLGIRVLSPNDHTTPFFSQSFKPITAPQLAQLRYSLAIAEGPQEIAPGKFFPLECNMNELNAISYSKGCYLGQELVARVHHTGVIRKRIFGFRQILEDSKTHAPRLSFGDSVRFGGKSVGHVVSMEGGLGIAMLRTHETQQAFETHTALTVESSEGPAQLQPIIPEYLSHALAEEAAASTTNTEQ